MVWPWKASRQTGSHSLKGAEDGEPCQEAVAGLCQGSGLTIRQHRGVSACPHHSLCSLSPFPTQSTSHRQVTGYHWRATAERHKCSQANDTRAWDTHSYLLSGAGHAGEGQEKVQAAGYPFKGTWYCCSMGTSDEFQGGIKGPPEKKDQIYHGTTQQTDKNSLKKKNICIYICISFTCSWINKLIMQWFH